MDSDGLVSPRSTSMIPPDRHPRTAKQAKTSHNNPATAETNAEAAHADDKKVLHET